MERVIFRKEYDPFMRTWGYIAAFPDDEAAPGRIAAAPFKIKADGTAIFENYTEIATGYIYGKTRLVRRHAPEINQLRQVLQDYYGTQFRVCEKVS